MTPVPAGEDSPAESPGLGRVMREMTGPVYAPSLMYAIAQNAVVIMLPLYALRFDDGAALAALMLGARGAGVLIADLPAGMLVSRFGDKAVMLLGQAILIAVTLAAAFFDSALALVLVALGTGAGGGIWLMGRLAYISDHVALEQRGRVISVMAGIHRSGALVGPIIAGVGVQALGYPTTFTLLAGLYVVSLAISLASGRGIRGTSARHHVPLMTVIHAHRRIFATAGTVMIVLQILRNARIWIIPVWGSTLGLDEATIGFVFSASSAVDMLMFLPAGLLLDHVGRRYALTPALAILGTAIALMPLTGDLWTFAAAAVAMGLGNGFSTGTMMTLGADFSPVDGRGEFLGVWRLVGDIGTTTGPMLIGALAQFGTVATASLATGALGVLGVAVLWAFVPETLNRRPRERAR